MKKPNGQQKTVPKPLEPPPMPEGMKLDSISCQVCHGVLLRIAGGQGPVLEIHAKPHVIMALRREPYFSMLTRFGSGKQIEGTIADIPVISNQTLKTDVELR